MKINEIFLKMLLTIFFVTLIVSLSQTLMISAVDTTYSTLIPENAKHIQTAAQLADIGGIKSAGEYYVLDNDINLVDEWVPIEDFSGTFDGQGYSINNLYVLKSSNRENAGLFGTVINVVTIKNVGVNINSNGVTASSSSGYTSAGGLVGRISGSISCSISVMNCYVTGDVTATSTNSIGYACAGGLLGMSDIYSSSIDITNCYVVGDVTATSPGYVYTGGLVGASCSVYVGKCSVVGDVTATSPSGYAYAGGLVGGGDNGTVENCYVVGDVTAVSSASVVYAGGLIGSGPSLVNIRNCYVVGDVTATSRFGRAYAGDLIGSDRRDNYVSHSYFLFDQTVNGGTLSYVGESLSSDAMKNQQSFIGWDFENIWAINSNTNGGYPYLRGLIANNGNGSLETTTPQSDGDDSSFLSDQSTPSTGSNSSSGDGQLGGFRLLLFVVVVGVIWAIIGVCILLLRKRKTGVTVV
ncbi:MAG: hypothetical protein FWD52_06695 [Candidatus Bathyarchaeota archaeon]|nr:hypothetical protein [Candidatus Termiticorpusculum sp.]